MCIHVATSKQVLFPVVSVFREVALYNRIQKMFFKVINLLKMHRKYCLLNRDGLWI